MAFADTFGLDENHKASSRGSPAVESGVTLFHCDKNTAACRRNLPAGLDLRIYGGAISFRAGDVGAYRKVDVERRRPPKRNGELRGHRARQYPSAGPPHEMPCSRPVRVAIEERATNPAVQHSGECQMMGLRSPDTQARVIALGEASDAKALVVLRAAAEANALRREGLLETLRVHALRVDYAFLSVASAGDPVSAGFFSRQAASCFVRRAFCLRRRRGFCGVLMGRRL